MSFLKILEVDKFLCYSLIIFLVKTTKKLISKAIPISYLMSKMSPYFLHQAFQIPFSHPSFPSQRRTKKKASSNIPPTLTRSPHPQPQSPKLTAGPSHSAQLQHLAPTKPLAPIRHHHQHRHYHHHYNRLTHRVLHSDSHRQPRLADPTFSTPPLHRLSHIPHAAIFVLGHHHSGSSGRTRGSIPPRRNAAAERPGGSGEPASAQEAANEGVS